MKNMIILAGIACAMVTFTACEDQLDVVQHGAVSSEAFYSNDQECLEGLSALYKDLELSWPVNDGHLGMAISDDCYAGGGSRGNDASWEQLNELTFEANNSYVKNAFQTYYNTVYRANMLIDHCTGGTSLQNRIVNEAKVVRAFTYLRLACYYGDAPLILNEVTDGNYQFPVSSRAELFAQIEKDLEEAIASGTLLEKSSVADQVVNVTKQTAQALLGKVYVYESTFLGTDRWADARQMLEAVINSGKYALVDVAHYQDMFHNDGRFSTESLFETNRILDAQNLVRVWMTYRQGFRVNNVDQTQLKAAAAAGLINNTYSQGYFNATIDLYNTFVELEGENGARLHQVLMPYKDMVQMPLCLGKQKSFYGTEGIMMTKLAARDNERITNHMYGQDIVFLRYADVLLLAAEANLPTHGGNQAKCDDYMNQVKQRAGELSMPGNYTLADIQKERRVELCFEGSRYFDLVRWGIIAEVYKDKGKRIPAVYGLWDQSDNTGNELHENVQGYNVGYFVNNSHHGWMDRYAVLPIPQDELNVNPLIEQNALWK